MHEGEHTGVALVHQGREASRNSFFWYPFAFLILKIKIPLSKKKQEHRFISRRLTYFDIFTGEKNT
jgi:hypothetical protein